MSSDEKFSCSVVPERDRVRVVLAGEFDLAVVATVDSELSTLMQVGFRRILVDLRATTFMDSAGLHCLVRWDRKAKENGHEFSVTRSGGQVRRLFEIVGVEDHFRSDETHAAPASFGDNRAATAA